MPEGSNNHNSKVFLWFAIPRAVASLLTLPPATVLLHKQVRSVDSYRNIMQNICNKKGVKGFFVGAELQVMKNLFRQGLIGVGLTDMAKGCQTFFTPEQLERNPHLPYVAAAPFAGAVAAAVSAPFDGARVRRNLHEGRYSFRSYIGDAYENGGVLKVGKSVVNGGTVEWLGRSFQLVGFHIAYPGLQAMLKKMSNECSGDNKFANIILPGAMAGAVSTTAALPLNRMFTEMQRHKCGEMYSYRQAVADIYKANGARGFWSGLSIAAMRALFNGAAHAFAVEKTMSRGAGTQGRSI